MCRAKPNLCSGAGAYVPLESVLKVPIGGAQNANTEHRRTAVRTHADRRLWRRQPTEPAAPNDRYRPADRDTGRSEAALGQQSRFGRTAERPIMLGGKSGPGAPSMAQVPGLGHPAPVRGPPAQVIGGVNVREKFRESFSVARTSLSLWQRCNQEVHGLTWSHPPQQVTKR
jgi:hypothetical protein